MGKLADDGRFDLTGSGLYLEPYTDNNGNRQPPRIGRCFVERENPGDLVLHDVAATWFGGGNDPNDNSVGMWGDSTASASLVACSLPMYGCNVPATDGSPIPLLKRHYPVHVYNPDTGAELDIPLYDDGPGAGGNGGIDLTKAAWAALGANWRRDELRVHVRICGGVAFLSQDVQDEIAAAFTPPSEELARRQGLYQASGHPALKTLYDLVPQLTDRAAEQAALLRGLNAFDGALVAAGAKAS